MALAGKVAIITGSSCGIGAGIAVCFAKEGASVSITGRNQEKLEAVAAKCKTFGSNNVTITTGDITNDDVRKKIVRHTIETFGKIDILVNNAGVLLIGSLCDVTEQHYNDVMDINLKTPILMTSLVSEHLVKNKGNVINITSINSEVNGPGTGIYATSKAGLEKYTKCLALELSPKGVRVNGISPGYIPTEIANRGNIPPDGADTVPKAMVKATLLGRSGTPDEIGQAAVFLASDNASFITGQILVTDGGLRLTPGF